MSIVTVNAKINDYTKSFTLTEIPTGFNYNQFFIYRNGTKQFAFTSNDNLTVNYKNGDIFTFEELGTLESGLYGTILWIIHIVNQSTYILNVFEPISQNNPSTQQYPIVTYRQLRSDNVAENISAVRNYSNSSYAIITNVREGDIKQYTNQGTVMQVIGHSQTLNVNTNSGANIGYDEPIIDINYPDNISINVEDTNNE